MFCLLTLEWRLESPEQQALLALGLMFSIVLLSLLFNLTAWCTTRDGGDLERLPDLCVGRG